MATACRKLAVDGLATTLKGRFLQMMFQQNPDKSHVCLMLPCLPLPASLSGHSLLPISIFHSQLQRCFSPVKGLGVFVPVPCLGPTWLLEEILIKSCSAFMSNMLQRAIHLSDAGIAYLVFLTPSKQLVQGSSRIRIGSWIETA